MIKAPDLTNGQHILLKQFFIPCVQREFPDMFKVWYDYLGGDAIGLTWGKGNPKVCIFPSNLR